MNSCNRNYIKKNIAINYFVSMSMRKMHNSYNYIIKNKYYFTVIKKSQKTAK